ncbi:nicotinate (nicotinamide) nucleotide adenylyltransferase [Amedibacillus sp. YH-ame6]
MRIAVLGGSFDPIHVGHLQIAKTALKKLSIDEVWFMPTKETPLKEGQCASFQDRAMMVKLAIQPYRHMRLCTLENEWEDRSYTIRTVKELQRRYPMHTFCWLIGDDQGQHFDAWKDSEELKKRIPFFVFSRIEEKYTLPQGLTRVPMDLVRVSSTQLRAGHQLYRIPKSVLRYIGKKGLYIEDMIQDKMNEKRYVHSVSVANLCVQLAKAHQLDTRVAYLMGIAHDVCKQLPLAQASIWMKTHLPQNMEEASSIWHGYIGADYIRKHFYMDDRRICEAIYHHVKGRNRTDYDRILYIADKLDPSRGYDSSKQIEISMKCLKEGFTVVKQEQQTYLKKEGIIKE